MRNRRYQFKKKLRKQEYLQLFTAHNTNWFLCFIRQCILFSSFFSQLVVDEKKKDNNDTTSSFDYNYNLRSPSQFADILIVSCNCLLQQRNIYNYCYTYICILTFFLYSFFNFENLSFWLWRCYISSISR